MAGETLFCLIDLMNMQMATSPHDKPPQIKRPPRGVIANAYYEPSPATFADFNLR